MPLLINIDVDDLAAAERFYVGAFRLQPGRRFEGALELLGFQAPLYLLEKNAGSTPVPGNLQLRDYRRHWTPIHFDVVVDDLQDALQRALAAGAVQEQPVKTAAWGHLALLADPFGHGFCLLQFLNRGYDEIAL